MYNNNNDYITPTVDDVCNAPESLIIFVLIQCVAS